MSTTRQGRATGVYYKARVNYRSNSWGGLEYQGIRNTVAMVNYGIKLFSPDVFSIEEEQRFYYKRRRPVVYLKTGGGRGRKEPTRTEERTRNKVLDVDSVWAGTR